MGEVYLVAHPRLPRQDALKILPPDMSADAEFRARFNREAESAATLYNPHIVGIHDRGEFAGQLWISMDYAHERGLMHRDIKPPNILPINPERGRRRILLADFGIVRNAAEVSGLTDTNVTLGTVNYVAPEQLMGAPIDGRADQYGLAATAYHLLTGFPIFGSSSNPAVVIGRHLNAAPPTLTDSRPDLAALDPVLAKALSKNPDDRFPSCTDFANALGWAMTSGGGRSLPSFPAAAAPEPPPQVRERGTAILPTTYPAVSAERPVHVAAPASRWPWLLAAVGLVLILGVLAFAVWPRDQRSASSPADPATSTARSMSTTPATHRHFCIGRSGQF